MFLSLLNRKEMLKFLDLAIYMVDIDGEPTISERRVLAKMMAEVDEVKDEFTFQFADSVENTISFFTDSNKVVKNIVYLNLVTITMDDDLYNTKELGFLEKVQKQLDISDEKRRELISIVYAERDLREKSIRIIKN